MTGLRASPAAGRESNDLDGDGEPKSILARIPGLVHPLQRDLDSL
jgi:hypothetical protein